MKNLAHKKRRRLQPRPPVTAPPIVVSDLTCFDLAGLTPRQFRDLLARHRDVPRVVAGQRLLIRADALLALLDRLAAADADRQPLESHEDDDGITVDSLLASVGRRIAR